MFVHVCLNRLLVSSSVVALPDIVKIRYLKLVALLILSPLSTCRLYLPSPIVKYFDYFTCQFFISRGHIALNSFLTSPNKHHHNFNLFPPINKQTMVLLTHKVELSGNNNKPSFLDSESTMLVNSEYICFTWLVNEMILVSYTYLFSRLLLDDQFHFQTLSRFQKSRSLLFIFNVE